MAPLASHYPWLLWPHTIRGSSGLTLSVAPLASHYPWLLWPYTIRGSSGFTLSVAPLASHYPSLLWPHTIRGSYQPLTHEEGTTTPQGKKPIYQPKTAGTSDLDPCAIWIQVINHRCPLPPPPPCHPKHKYHQPPLPSLHALLLLLLLLLLQGSMEGWAEFIREMRDFYQVGVGGGAGEGGGGKDGGGEGAGAGVCFGAGCIGQGCNHACDLGVRRANAYPSVPPHLPRLTWRV